MSHEEGIFIFKRDLFIALGALVIAIMLALGIFWPQAVETGAWGLSYSTTTPSGPVSSAQLARYNACYLGDTTQKVLYLTFDAGYENGCTAQILDVLKKHQVPAAFFLVGNYLEKEPDLVRRMVAEGHIVGNHTMHHPDMTKSTDPNELTELEELYRAVTGQELPKFYRPPQGLYSQENLEMAQKLGYKTVFWSLAYVDWNNDSQPTKEYAFGKLLPRTHNGAIILLHSTSKTNAAILEELLTKWKEEGYTFLPLTDLPRS